MGKEKSEAPAPKKGSCIGKLAALLVLLGIAAFGAAVFMMLQSQDLSDIEGRSPADGNAKSRNLMKVLARSHEDGHVLKLTEKEINLYLRDTLKAQQGGALAGQASLDDVMLRLEEGRAEVIMLRTVAGMPVTLSMYLRLEQTETPRGSIRTEIFRNGGPYMEGLSRPAVGGRFGKLPVPEGFLLLVMPSFEKLAKVYRDASATTPNREIDYIEEMVRVKIEDGRLVLDPRGEQGKGTSRR